MAEGFTRGGQPTRSRTAELVRPFDPLMSHPLGSTPVHGDGSHRSYHTGIREDRVVRTNNDQSFQHHQRGRGGGSRQGQSGENRQDQGGESRQGRGGGRNRQGRGGGNRQGQGAGRNRQGQGGRNGQVQDGDRSRQDRGGGSGQGQQHHSHGRSHNRPLGSGRGGRGATAIHQEDNGTQACTRTAQYWQKHEVINLASKSLEAILDKVVNEEESFFNAFKYKQFLDNSRVLQCLIKILYSITASANVDAQIMPFATKIISKVFTNCDGFILKLQSLIQSIEFGNNSSCLIDIFGLAVFSVKHAASSTLLEFPHKLFQFAVDEQPTTYYLNHEQYEDYCQEYREKRKELNESRQHTEVVVVSSLHSHHHFNSDMDRLHDLPPPDDYTECSILPKPSEINDSKYEPFLRSNLISEDYHDASHYLDVQFRLLREDFVGPLRSGIDSLSDVRPEVTIYRGVRILEPICLYNGVGFQIQFDLQESRLDRVQWEHSRRLIYGSLLCFSSDEKFEKILFATVVDRDAKQLKEAGRFIVKFEGEESHMAAFHCKPSHRYIMIESSAYFEAYRHVLEGLQQLVPDQMPFQPYLVQGCPIEIPPPLFLRRCSFFNLSNVLEYDPVVSTYNYASTYHFASFRSTGSLNRVDVTQPVTDWPNQKSLDESQLKALQMALSQELSIIQGPPGTGKTFIGLKIVQALLENKEVWDPSRNSPILVICYTNHALDQFLEGIVSNESRPNVVRIGGRCKSQLLKPFVLANRITEMRKKRLFSAHIAKPLTKKRAEMGKNQDKFEETLSAIDLVEGKILSLDELQDAHVINSRHYHQLQLLGAGQESIEVWLGLIDHNSSADIEESEENSNDDDDDLIDVLDEPQLLEEDRLEDGDEYNFTKESLKKREAYRNSRRKNKKRKSPQEEEWQVVKPSQKQRKRKIHEWMKETPMTADEVLRVNNILNLTPKDRWRLYLNWVDDFIMSSKGALSELADEYNDLALDCKQFNEEINIEAMGNVDVVGMTTTGAAKHSYMLSKLNPKIVIVEEAAEVMEAHIVTSLSSSVQQLILIGDHKQLQPKPAFYDLEVKYNFNISLFERLIEKGVPHVTLTQQHRMRPEIARIVGNHVYDRKLFDAGNVKEYPPIKGIEKNLFFIEHKHKEKSDGSNDNRSRSNVFEADYVTSFTNHLLKQGYKPNQITILTMYRGQLLEIKQRMKKKTFDGVKVAAVDDFQGEENDIIILSLVRSNTRDSIGFLKIENRVCVALSRAKHGMFVIGDFSMLRNKINTIWPRLLEDMERNKFLADALPLCCQNHPKEKTLARTPEDFSELPAGGCKKLCDTRLNCGHVCKSMCHPMDHEHKGIYKCTQKCGKRLVSCGHSCSQRCFKCSGLEGCGPCKEKVRKRHPLCGHFISTQCSTNPSTVKCMENCEKQIACGHKCTNKCSEPCISEDLCKTPCTAQLDCGHKCKGNCGRCNKGRLHVPCSEKCQRILECGHNCESPCTRDCPPCEKKCRNRCVHSRCPKKCSEPCEPCREPCKWKCKHFKCRAACGEMCTRPPCDRPCQELIKKCGHQCIGLCGEKCPDLCRVCDKDEVENVFFGTEADEGARFIKLEDCGHIFEVSGMDQWMGLEYGAVQFKECPKCKTPIQRSLRYGNTVKAAIQEMEKVKKEKLSQEVYSSDSNLFRRQSLHLQVQHLISKCSRQHEDVGLEPLLRKIEAALVRGECRTQYLNTIENQLSIIPMLIDIANSQVSLIAGTGFTFISEDCLSKDFKKIRQFIDKPLLSSQQVNDAKAEAIRVLCLSLICKCRAAIMYGSYSDIDATDDHEMTSLAQLLMEMGWKKDPPSEKMLSVVKTKVQAWNMKE